MEHIETDEVAKFEKVVYGYCAPVLYVLGIAGCVANILTLPKRKFSARLYFYLRSLSVSDLIYLCLVIPNLSRIVQSQSRDPYSANYHAQLYRIVIELELINGFFTASVFIIVSMTIDRYYAICHPLEYTKSRKYINPRIYVLISFFCGLVMHIPHCFEKTVEPVDCVALVSNNTKVNIPQCWCFNTSSEDKESLVCSYFGHNIEGLHDTIIWKTYVVLCELMVRFGPALLLIGLNVAMIRHFNNVISASNVYLTPTTKKSIPTIRIFTVENETNEETKSQQITTAKKETSFLMEPMLEVQPRLKLTASLSSLTSVSFIHSSRQRRRKVGAAADKPFERERNVILTLALITVMFTIGTVPIGIVRIVRNFDQKIGVENPNFAKFRIIANLLEICNASINFYLYCLFNTDIRENVRKTIKSTFQIKKKPRQIKL